MKRNTKTILGIIGTVLLSVMACALVFTLTNGFTGKRALNEDNLLYDTYSDMKKKTYANGLTLSQDNGVIDISGKTDEEAAVIELCKVTLKAGTYTYTCFENAAFNGCYSFLEFTDSSVKTRVYGDFEDLGEMTVSGVTVNDSNTFTLSSETEVTVYIAVAADNDDVNAKAYPVLVSGKEAGDFYAPIFGDKK